jgi:hypothetical protein
MRAFFTSHSSYDRGSFDHLDSSTGVIDFLTGSSGYVNELYVTGSDGDWCQVLCATPFSCEDLSGCNVVFRTGDQYISGDLTISGIISGSGLNINDCSLTVTTGGRIGINTCDPQCDVDIRGDICQTSGNYLNNSGYISGKTGIFDWLSGNSGYMRDEFTVGTGDCVFIVTTGGDIGINTCEPLCDIDIRGDICQTSGNYLNNSGYISGKTGIFDWLSGNSGYMRDEFTVGTGDCVFIVTTGGDIGINTCEPLCDIDIRGDICHNSGNYINNSGYISGKTGIFEEGLIVSGLNPILWTGVPATDTSYGLPGLAAYDNTHLYVCTGADKWGRTNLTGWN